MLHQMLIHRLLVGIEGRGKDEKDVSLLQDVRRIIAMVRLQASIADCFKAVARLVIAGGLLGIAHPEGYVVKAMVSSYRWLFSLVLV